jgi:hypothetical protein
VPAGVSMVYGGRGVLVTNLVGGAASQRADGALDCASSLLQVGLRGRGLVVGHDCGLVWKSCVEFEIPLIVRRGRVVIVVLFD